MLKNKERFMANMYIFFDNLFTDLLATSVEMRTDLCLALNLVKVAILLFCDICPCNGTAVNPKLRNKSAVLIVLLHVEQNIIKLFPDNAFSM